jgi:hypothetical protein
MKMGVARIGFVYIQSCLLCEKSYQEDPRLPNSQETGTP